MASKLSLWVALGALIAAFAAPVWAAKEKFERNKPHVNVGAIGLGN